MTVLMFHAERTLYQGQLLDCGPKNTGSEELNLNGIWDWDRRYYDHCHRSESSHIRLMIPSN